MRNAAYDQPLLELALKTLCLVVSHEHLRPPASMYPMVPCAFPATTSQLCPFRRILDHGAGTAQVPGAEVGEEQDRGGFGTEPGPEEGRSCYRP